MRILWMKPIVPWPPHQGTRRVTLQVLRALAPAHRVHLFCRRIDPGDREAVASLTGQVPGLTVAAPLAPNRRSPWHRVGYRLRAWGAARTGVPALESLTAAPSLVRAFAREAEDFRPDLTVVEYWYAAPYLSIPRTGARVLLAHDLDYTVRPGEREARREKQVLAAAPRVWFLTGGDRDRACGELGLDADRAEVLPYGLDLDGELRPPGPADPPEDPDRVLFLGSFAADFNRDALRFLREGIWPLLRRRRPRTRLVVAGRGLSSRETAACRTAGLEVLGGVEEVRPVLASAAVVLIPLRFGGGLRIRLLESLALERAVVGTPVGVLGMGPRAEREVRVAEDPEGLAAAVVDLLDDTRARRELGRAGRAWVSAHHALAPVALRQRELVETAIRSAGIDTPHRAG